MHLSVIRKKYTIKPKKQEEISKAKINKIIFKKYNGNKQTGITLPFQKIN